MDDNTIPKEQIPDWLTKDFLEKLLDKNQDIPGCKTVITKYKVFSDIPKGNNYLSDILKIGIDYNIISPASSNFDSLNKVSLLAKMEITEGLFAPLNNKGIFTKELGIYNELLPKLHSVLHEHDDYDTLAPKLFKSDLEDVMIMEDLGARGYRMGDRKKQLDYDHGAIVVKKMAKLHAASAKLHEMNPELVERYGSDEIFKRDFDPDVKKVVDPVIGEAQLEMVTEEFEKWPETKKFVSFLKKLKPKLWEIFCDIIHAYDGEFAVFCHGDAWTNNMLFSYDELGKPKDLLFIDFQLAKYTTPAYDLTNFFHTSIPYEILKQNFHNLTQIYLDNLNYYLDKYGSSQRLKESDFRKSLEKREIYALIRCINILPFMFAEYDEDDNEPKDGLLSTQNFIRNKTFITVCAKYLEDFSKKPWFKNFE